MRKASSLAVAALLVACGGGGGGGGGSSGGDPISGGASALAISQATAAVSGMFMNLTPTVGVSLPASASMARIESATPYANDVATCQYEQQYVGPSCVGCTVLTPTISGTLTDTESFACPGGGAESATATAQWSVNCGTCSCDTLGPPTLQSMVVNVTMRFDACTADLPGGNGRVTLTTPAANPMTMNLHMGEGGALTGGSLVANHLSVSGDVCGKSVNNSDCSVKAMASGSSGGIQGSGFQSGTYCDCQMSSLAANGTCDSFKCD